MIRCSLIIILGLVLAVHLHAEDAATTSPVSGKIWNLSLTQAGKPAGDLQISFTAELLRSPWLAKAGFASAPYTLAGKAGAWRLSVQHEEKGRTLMLSANIGGVDNGMIKGTLSVVEKDGTAKNWSFKQAPGTASKTDDKTKKK